MSAPNEPTRDLIPVMGHCPMGCGKTLALGSAGGVTCGGDDCPDPLAVHRILADPQTEHVIRLHDDGFTVQHPLRERIAGDLFVCAVHGQIAALDGPPQPPGDYLLTISPAGEWTWTPLAEAVERRG